MFDLSAIAFAILVFGLVYIGLLNAAPALARLWLCAGGAVIGGAAITLVILALGILFGSLGLALWSIAFGMLFGVPAGAWLTWRLTKPPA
jgi:hypothetical protein